MRQVQLSVFEQFWDCLTTWTVRSSSGASIESGVACCTCRTGWYSPSHRVGSSWTHLTPGSLCVVSWVAHWNTPKEIYSRWPVVISRQIIGLFERAMIIKATSIIQKIKSVLYISSNRMIGTYWYEPVAHVATSSCQQGSSWLVLLILCLFCFPEDQSQKHHWDCRGLTTLSVGGWSCGGSCLAGTTADAGPGILLRVVAGHRADGAGTSGLVNEVARWTVWKSALGNGKKSQSFLQWVNLECLIHGKNCVMIAQNIHFWHIPFNWSSGICGLLTAVSGSLGCCGISGVESWTRTTGCSTEGWVVCTHGTCSAYIVVVGIQKVPRPAHWKVHKSAQNQWQNLKDVQVCFAWQGNLTVEERDVQCFSPILFFFLESTSEGDTQTLWFWWYVVSFIVGEKDWTQKRKYSEHGIWHLHLKVKTLIIN